MQTPIGCPNLDNTESGSDSQMNVKSFVGPILTAFCSIAIGLGLHLYFQNKERKMIALPLQVPVLQDTLGELPIGECEYTVDLPL